MAAQRCQLVDCISKVLSLKFFSNYFFKKPIYLHMVQFVVSSREVVQLPQHSQVPDVIDVIATDVQDTKRILNKDSNIRF